MATQDEWDIVMKLVDQMAPALVAEFMLFIEQQTNEKWVTEVANAIENGDWLTAQNAIVPAAALEQFGPALGLAMRSVYDDLGLGMAKTMRPLKPPIGPPVEFRFDVLDQKVVDMVSRHSTSLMKEFSSTMKAGVRQYLIDGMRRKLPPREVALGLKKDKIVGLSARGAQAVANYRAKLMGTDRKSVLAGALQNQLRDKRFDSVVTAAMNSGAQLPKEKIDQIVQRYADRLLAHELRVLSHTETLQAHEWTKQQLWLDAITRGYIDPKSYVKKWYVAKDERTCKVCQGIAAMNPNGVPITGFFKTPSGVPLASPLAHPLCRCITLVTAKK